MCLFVHLRVYALSLLTDMLSIFRSGKSVTLTFFAFSYIYFIFCVRHGNLQSALRCSHFANYLVEIWSQLPFLASLSDVGTLQIG